MPAVNFSDFFLRSLTPRTKQFDVRDAKVTGLLIRVSPGGTKTFVLWYRIGNEARRLTLGRYPTLRLADARSQAQAALRLVATGKDPAAEKQKARLNYSATLFPVVLAEYIERYAKPHTKGWKETNRLLQREFAKRWSLIPIHDISKRDVTQVLHDMVERGSPSAANHAHAAIRALFNWAVGHGHLNQSPCLGLRAPSGFVQRERVLGDDEITRIWNAAENMGWPYGTIIQILILTGQHRGEVVGMRWSELDLPNATWTIPAERTKPNRTHKLPLSTATVRILQSLPNLHDALVFPARGNAGAVSGFSKWKRELDAAAGLTNWRLHDIRRTVATGLAGLAVPPHVVERLLNHKTGTLGGIAGIYNRHDYFDSMKAAATQWAQRVDNAVRVENANELPGWANSDL